MRKMYKQKKRSCAMCKPHKRGGAYRWTNKEKEAIKRFSKAVAKRDFREF